MSRKYSSYSGSFLKVLSKILFKKSAASSRGGPGPFEGLSSYPQLCCWSLIYAARVPIPHTKLKSFAAAMSFAPTDTTEQ